MDKMPTHIPIEEVCKERSYYIERFSEGNAILKDILELSIDKYLTNRSIAPFECCEGHDCSKDTYVMFNIDYNHKEYIYSIINAIASSYRIRYALGQEKYNNTISLDVRLPFDERTEADQFLKQIKLGLERAKKFKQEEKYIKKMISMLENTNVNGYQLVMKKFTDIYFDERDYYAAMLIKENGEPLVNQPHTYIEYFDLDNIDELKPENFSSKGIQKIIKKR